MKIMAETKDIKLSLPVTLWEELQKLIPQWQQSQFWIELLNRELRRIRFEQAWRAAAGAWSDEAHPDLVTATDIDAHVRRLRETSLVRSWDEIIVEDTDD
jgi:hypothetical protein